jgi:hypothetical protein
LLVNTSFIKLLPSLGYHFFGVTSLPHCHRPALISTALLR